MKAILKFDLNDVDDRMAHKDAILAHNYKHVISEIRAELRRIQKFGNLEEPIASKFDKLVDMFYEILSDNNIDLSEI